MLSEYIRQKIPTEEFTMDWIFNFIKEFKHFKGSTIPDKRRFTFFDTVRFYAWKMFEKMSITVGKKTRQ